MFSAIHRNKFLISRLIDFFFIFEKLTQIERKFNITLPILIESDYHPRIINESFEIHLSFLSHIMDYVRHGKIQGQ